MVPGSNLDAQASLSWQTIEGTHAPPMSFISTTHQLQSPIKMPLRGVVQFRKKFKDAELSCSREIDASTHGLPKRVWWPCGPAMQKFEAELVAEIDGLLNNVELGEAELYLRLYMIGKRPSSSRPVIMVCCSNAQVRAQAVDAIRMSDILQLYPGFGLGSSALPLEQPGLVRALTDDPGNDHFPHHTEATTSQKDKPNDAGHTTEATPLVGRRIRILPGADNPTPFSEPRLATGGAVIRIGSQEYQITACHVLAHEPGSESVTCPNSLECSFDDMDDEDEDEDLLSWEPDARITTSASRAPEDHAEGHSNLLNTSTESRNASNTDGNSSTLSTLRQVEKPQDEQPITLAATSFPTGLRSDHGSNPGLDYALIPIRFMLPSRRDPDERPNEIRIRDELVQQKRIEIRSVANIPAQERHVFAVTGSRGVIPGVLVPSAMYHRNATLRHLQKLYPVHLLDSIDLGDSGSVVIDKISRGLYGHIVRGTPGSSIAYIVPASEVFEDLRRLSAAAVELAWSITPSEDLSGRNMDTNSSDTRLISDPSSRFSSTMDVDPPQTSGTQTSTVPVNRLATPLSVVDDGENREPQTQPWSPYQHATFSPSYPHLSDPAWSFAAPNHAELVETDFDDGSWDFTSSVHDVSLDPGTLDNPLAIGQIPTGSSMFSAGLPPYDEPEVWAIIPPVEMVGLELPADAVGLARAPNANNNSSSSSYSNSNNNRSRQPGERVSHFGGRGGGGRGGGGRGGGGRGGGGRGGGAAGLGGR